jgi:SAM-dependent methyltransferase
VGDWFRDAFGELYPLVYPHRDVAEAAGVAATLAPLIRSGRPTLDVACGNGRYLRALTAAGVNVVGVDLSEYLLGEAVNEGQGDAVVCGDMRALPFRPGTFGSAINMFTSFGYFDNDDDNSRALAEIARVVVPGGVFVLDFINAGRVRRTIDAYSHRSAGDAHIEEWRELTDARRVLTKRVRVSWPDRAPVEYSERLRLYTRPELTALLDAGGFDVARVHGDYQLGPFDESVSPRLLFICHRRVESA